MKNILIAVVVLLVIAGGYVLYTMIEGGEEVSAPTSDGAVSGEVVHVDLSGIAADGPALITIETEDGERVVIAVPSMGLPLCAARERIAAVDQIEVGDRISVNGEIEPVGRIVPCEDVNHFLEVTAVERDEEVGYQFEYRKGPDGYVALSDEETHGSDFVSGIVLFNRAEYEELQQNTDAREGPPAMHVRVYANTGNLHAPVWAMRNPRESNVELAIGETEEAVVAGANAEHYVADGLWPINTYVVAHGGYMFVLMGAYPDMEAPIYEDFQTLVSSFEFIPASRTVE